MASGEGDPSVSKRSALVKLRAQMVRLAHEVEALEGGEDIARQMRDAAMSAEMVEASNARWDPGRCGPASR